MPIIASALIEKTDRERSGELLTIDHGASFWKYRDKSVTPNAYLSQSEVTSFAGRGAEENVVALQEAINYWETKAERSAFSFLKLKEDGGLKQVSYFVNLVLVVHAVDDDAPWDATHKMFVPADLLTRGTVTSTYVKLVNASNPNQKRIDKPKENKTPSANITLEVWDGHSYQTKTDSQLEEFILTTDPQRGKSNVKRCVSAMTRGGKFTVKYGNELTKDVLHASKGKRGDSGTCSVFYVDYLNKVRLIAIGHHTGNASYSITWSEPTIVQGNPNHTPVMRSAINLES